VTGRATPAAAKRLLLWISALGVAAFSLLLWRSSGDLSALSVLVLTAAVAGGEAFTIDLPYRKGGIARFTLSYPVIAAGLLLVPGVNVAFAAALGIAVWMLVEGTPRLKFAVNVAQYLVAAAAGGLAVDLLATSGGPITPRTFAAAAVGMTLCSLVNLVVVSGMIAAFGDRSWRATTWQLAPTSGLLAGGSIALGLLAVLMATDHLWALPTLVVPLGLLHAASRREVQAQVDRERAVAYVDIEQRLAEAADPELVHHLLVDGVRSVLDAEAAVWANGVWVTPVPEGSGVCPVDDELTGIVARDAAGLGVADPGAGMAMGVGNGVLVVWGGRDGLSREWLERLGASGRVHAARSEGAVALRRERATLRAIVHGTADGIYVTDAAGAVLVCNPAMAELAQTSLDELIGQPVEQVLGGGAWEDEGVRDVTREGDRVWRVSVSAIRDRTHGDLRVGVVHDVTAERRVARMKDDMLSIVSHELRTPLTPIKGSAQLLRRRWDRMDEQRRDEMLRTIEGRADHLARLVEDLLLVGQMSAAGRATPRVRPVAVDLAQLCREAVEQLDHHHPDHTVRLLSPETVPLTTDPLRVRQIVDNLVNNACKFSGAGSTVSVEVSVEETWAVVRVVDQGRGIPPEDLERVFERFERVEDPLHMTTSGAGLGLYIVRSLAQGLGGDVAIASTLGKGTTVTIHLPLQLAPALTPAVA